MDPNMLVVLLVVGFLVLVGHLTRRKRAAVVERMQVQADQMNKAGNKLMWASVPWLVLSVVIIIIFLVL